ALAAARRARQPDDLRAAGARIEPRAERFGAGAARLDPREPARERARRAVEDLARQCLDVGAPDTSSQRGVGMPRWPKTEPSELTRPFGLFYSSAAARFRARRLMKSTREEFR